MKSIRIKFTIALLLMSFAVIGIVGATARSIIETEFDDLVIDRSMDIFLEGITRYYQTYGSWEQARANEPFPQYVRRVQRPRARLARADLPAPGDRPVPGERPRPGDGRFRPPDEGGLGGGPPPFVVTDRKGVVQLPLANRKVGDVLSAADLAKGRPILVAGEEVGLAVPVQRPELSAMEQRYYAAIQNAWQYSLIFAVLLAVPIGIFLGSLFTRPIHALRAAMQAMREGNLKQSVNVSSGDEIGELSHAFNRMSSDLADTYRELEESRAKLKTQAAELHALSRQDELTNLPNRRAFDELAAKLFAQSQRYGHPLTLAIADVDHFKQINDRFSHSVGDKVLVELAGLISANIRDVDLMIRYGGEEFVFVLPETALENAARLMEKLRNLVVDHDWNGIAEGLAITLSFGLAERWPESTVQEVLEKADQKLYQAKESGRNRVCS